MTDLSSIYGQEDSEYEVPAHKVPETQPSIDLLPLTNRVTAIENDVRDLKKNFNRLENSIKSLYRSLLNLNGQIDEIEASLENKIDLNGDL